jgi:MFS family permease
MSKNEGFSGWKVLIGCFIVMFMTQGSIQTFAIFMPSMVEGIGTTVKAISLISTISTVTAFISNMFLSKVIDRIGIKQTMIIGSIANVLHFVIFAFSINVLHLYIGAFFGGISIAFVTLAPCSIIISNWFIEKRVTMISIVIAGSMFGGSIMMPLLGNLIQITDWRFAYLILSAILLLIPTIAILFLISESPNKKGQKPYGYEKHLGSTENERVEQETSDNSFSIIRRTSCFWLLIVGVLFVGISTNVENFLPMFWQRNGLSVAASSNYMGIYAFIAAIATIILGRVTDKLGGKVYMLMTTSLFIIGLVVITLTGTTNIVVMFIGLILFAFGAKKASSLIPPLVFQEAFGKQNLNYFPNSNSLVSGSTGVKYCG